VPPAARRSRVDAHPSAWYDTGVTGGNTQSDSFPFLVRSGHLGKEEKTA
jgi:hypothetical protein